MNGKRLFVTIVPAQNFMVSNIRFTGTLFHLNNLPEYNVPDLIVVTALKRGPAKN